MKITWIVRPPALLAVAAIAGLLTGCNEPKTQAPPPPVVFTAKPVSQTVTQYIPATGQAFAIQQVNLVARVQGYLTSINYVDGAAVKKGQLLFVIEQPPYQISLELAQAALAQQQAQLKNAQIELDRQQQLYVKQAASQAARDDAETRRDAAQAAVEQAAAQVKQAQLNLSYTEVRAPFDGIVTNHQVDVGAMVGVGGPTTLATIVQSAPLYVQFSLDEQLVQHIRDLMRERGMTRGKTDGAAVEMGLAVGKDFPYRAKIDYVSPSIDPNTGTLLVRALAPNSQGAILPGNFLRIRIPLPDPQKGLLVPDSALGASQGGRYVLLVNDKGLVEERHVDVGQVTDSGMRVILSGLTGDEQVIVGQAQGAVPGARVQAEPAPPAKAQASGAAGGSPANAGPASASPPSEPADGKAAR